MQWKLFTVGAVLCAAAGGGLISDYVAAEAAEASAWRADQEFRRGEVLPRSPSGMLRSMHSLVSQARGAGAEYACQQVAEAARHVIAEAFGQPDCQAAMRGLSEKVRQPLRYIQFHLDTRTSERISGDDGFVDGCAVAWHDFLEPAGSPDPGPRIGKLYLRRVAGLGFEITGFVPCGPADEPGARTPSSVPSAGPSGAPGAAAATPSPQVIPPENGLLPGYAASVPGILAGRIAAGGPGACALFTVEGQREFAAAQGVLDCPAAVAVLRGRVTDAALYANPTGATDKPGPAGRTVVDGCHLTWRRFFGTPAPPGPQIGQLELELPAGRAGYLIAGYRPC